MGRAGPVAVQVLGLVLFVHGAVGVAQGVRSERWDVTEARVVRYSERVPWYDSGAVEVDVDFEYESEREPGVRVRGGLRHDHGFMAVQRLSCPPCAAAVEHWRRRYAVGQTFPLYYEARAPTLPPVFGAGAARGDALVPLYTTNPGFVSTTDLYHLGYGAFLVMFGMLFRRASFREAFEGSGTLRSLIARTWKPLAAVVAAAGGIPAAVQTYLATRAETTARALAEAAGYSDGADTAAEVVRGVISAAASLSSQQQPQQPQSSSSLSSSSSSSSSSKDKS